MTRLSLFLTTLGRPTLPRMLESIRRQDPPPGVSLLLVSDDRHEYAAECWTHSGLAGRHVAFPGGPHPPYGHRLRNDLLPTIGAGHVWHVDDDDVLMPRGLALVLAAIEAAPAAFHIIPFLRHTDGAIIGRRIDNSYVGTPNFVHPAGVVYGTWGETIIGDFEFIRGTVAANPDREVIYHPEPAYLAYPPAGDSLDACWALARGSR